MTIGGNVFVDEREEWMRVSHHCYKGEPSPGIAIPESFGIMDIGRVGYATILPTIDGAGRQPLFSMPFTGGTCVKLAVTLRTNGPIPAFPTPHFEESAHLHTALLSLAFRSSSSPRTNSESERERARSIAQPLAVGAARRA